LGVLKIICWDFSTGMTASAMESCFSAVPWYTQYNKCSWFNSWVAEAMWVKFLSQGNNSSRKPQILVYIFNTTNCVVYWCSYCICYWCKILQGYISVFYVYKYILSTHMQKINKLWNRIRLITSWLLNWKESCII